MSFTLYPNPACSFIELNVKSGEPVLLQVLDIPGDVVIEKNILTKQQQLRVDISKLLPVTYIVTLSPGKEIIIKSF